MHLLGAVDGQRREPEQGACGLQPALADQGVLKDTRGGPVGGRLAVG